MYAIIRTGGKQQKVREGDVLDVERIKDGANATFTPLLVVGDDGSVISDKSALERASVTVEIVGEHRGNKIEGFTYKNKSGIRRRYGHRQTYSTIKVTKIDSGAEQPAKKAAAKADTEKAEAKKAETSKAEAKKAEAKKADTEKAEAKADTKKSDTKKSDTKKSETEKTESKAKAADAADAKAAADDSAAEEA